MNKFVQINPEELRLQYASLADDALLALDRKDLTDIARQFYDVEVASRRLNQQLLEPITIKRSFDGDEIEPDWIKDAACVFEQETYAGFDGGADAGAARDALEKARIPCKLTVVHVEPPPPRPYNEYRIMVPGRFALEASTVIDRDIYNADMESKWRTHFEELTDAELIAVDTEILFGGLLNRIERVKRAYAGELTRRDLIRR